MYFILSPSDSPVSASLQKPVSRHQGPGKLITASHLPQLSSTQTGSVSVAREEGELNIGKLKIISKFHYVRFYDDQKILQGILPF